MEFNIENLNNASRNTLAEALGIQITSCSAERIVATMPVGPKTHQPLGYLHGGASVALAETVASIGGWFHAGRGGKYVLGLEINANHLRSVRDGVVTAVGTPIHLGKTTQIWDIRITDEKQRLVCVSRCTLAVVEQKSN